MAVFVAGLVAMIVFYLLILVVGLVAGRKTKNNMEDAILASRKFGVFVSSMTLTATWVGGGMINGTAEAVANPYIGLVWTIAPWCYGLSLAVGGVMFGKTMRERHYITFLDPLQERFGRVMGVFLMLLSVVMGTLYVATILLALGSTVSVVVGVGLVPSTIVSVAIVVVYSFFGGLKSVAYTDLVQLPCILVGLVLAIPFAASHPAVSDITVNTTRWTGVWSGPLTATWIDTFIVLLLGALPVDPFLQRVLAAKSNKIALVSCFISSFGVLAFTLPPLFIGAIGANTDWSLTGYSGYIQRLPVNTTNSTQLPQVDYALILPLVIQYLTPKWVAVISLGAVSAAVMSSMDSSFIAMASEVANNFYKVIVRPKAGDKEVVWVMRAVVVLTATAATVVALTAKSIYAIFYLIGDFGGVLIFPQFFCAVHLTNTNTYGSLLALVVGLILRFGGGDALTGLPPFIKYPYYSDIYGQLFPYKTFAMVCTFLTLVSVSYLTKFLFESGILPTWMDIFNCFKKMGYDVKKRGEEVPMAKNVTQGQFGYKDNLGHTK